MNYIVTFDGPAGSGKSTIAKKVAKKLGFYYIDTGSIYRSLAFVVLNNGISIEDRSAIQKIALSFNKIVYSSEIRCENIGRIASIIAGYSEVRLALLKYQRALALQSNNNGAVLEGRDVGTVVFPEAVFKFFLTASVQQRAIRRMMQLKKNSQIFSYSSTLLNIVNRDTRDEKRDISPLMPAPDSIMINTDLYSIGSLVKLVFKIITNSPSKNKIFP